jgi:enolase
MKISQINAYEILASGGYPTIEVKVVLDSGATGIASVPYGESAGSREASVLLDKDENRYNGKGMLKAIQNIKEQIAPSLLGQDAQDQRLIDQTMIELDDTELKTNLGGNAILAVSLANARASAKEKNMPLYKHIAETFNTGMNFDSTTNLPSPMMVVIEGGKHADNSTDLQEYSLSAMGNESKTEQIRKTLESYHALKKILKENNLSTNVGNEGAFAPEGISSNEAPLDFITQAIEQAGYKPGVDLGISIDAAASEFYKDQLYHLSVEDQSMSSEELIAYFENWLQKYPIITIEDMLDENDWESWTKLTQVAKKYNVENIGDDLTVTNTKYLKKAIDVQAISAILIKLNQIGTLSETVDCCMLAKNHNMMTVPSHRGGGESNDTSMVDLAVAVGSRFIKVGPTRGERIAKYNRLMEIERDLGTNS